MKPIAKLFSTLVQTPSPSGKEKDVAAFLQRYIQEKVPSAQLYVDDTGIINNANTGNLIANITPNNTGKRIGVVIHMDTVETGEEVIIPVFGKDYITSKEDTILGVDNKAGMTALLTALDHVAEYTSVQLTLMFVTRGEAGVFGSSLLHPDLVQSQDLIIVAESSRPVGTIISQTVGYHHFRIEMRGQSAFASMEDEQVGINSLQAMCKAISSMQLGKLTDQTTLNIGSIHGGSGANMVPDICTVEGELRSFSVIEMNQVITKIRSIMEKTALEFGTSFYFHDFEKFPPYLLSRNHPMIREVEGILSTVVPLEHHRQRAFSDINLLAQYGPPCINIARGGEFPHTTEERITVSDLETLSTIFRTLFSKL